LKPKRKAGEQLDEVSSGSGSSSGDEENSPATYRNPEESSDGDESVQLNSEDGSSQSSGEEDDEEDNDANESGSEENGSSVSNGDVEELQPDTDAKKKEKIWSEDNCKFEPVLDKDGQLVFSEAFTSGKPVRGSTGFTGIHVCGGGGGNGTHVRGVYTDPVTKRRVFINESRSPNTKGGIMDCAKLSDVHLEERWRQTRDSRYRDLKHLEIIGGQQVHACATLSRGSTPMCAFDIPAQVRRAKPNMNKTSLYNGVSSQNIGFRADVTIDGIRYHAFDKSEIEAAKIYDRIVLATGSTKPLNFEWQRKPNST
jgi:hypothetical protein